MYDTAVAQRSAPSVRDWLFVLSVGAPIWARLKC